MLPFIEYTKAVVVLHKFLMLKETSLPRYERRYCPPGFADTEDSNADLVPGVRRAEVEKETGLNPVLRGRNSNAASKSARDVRGAFKKFFNSAPVAVPWKNEYINQ